MQQESALKREFSVGVTRLVFCSAVLVLLLTHCCEGQSAMIGPRKPIVALVGDDIILPCHLETATNVVSLTLEWARPDLAPRFVLVRRDGVELLLDQNPTYMGRTSVYANKLKCGDVSLKLSKVRLSDAGTYRCLIPSLEAEALLELVVGSVPSPVTVGVDRSGDGVTIECKSAGWYPEPEVLWLVAEGDMVSAGPTEMLRGPDGLYTVSSSVTVKYKHNNTFTCKLQHKYTNQTRETVIHIPDDFFAFCSSGAWRIAVSLAACSVFLLTAVLVVWKWSPNKTKMELKEKREERDDHQSREDQSLGTREQNVSRKQRNECLNTENEKHEEEFETTEEELTYVDEVIQALREHKGDLKRQREQIISLLQEVITEIQEKKRKVEKAVKVNKEKKTNITTLLEKRKKEQVILSASNEKLLDTTDDMINRMNVKRGKLEHHQQQLKRREKKTREQQDEEKPEQSTSIPITE